MKPTPVSEPENCQAYLVRMWRDSPQEPWRASVKLVADGRELHFVSPEKMFLYLHHQITGPVSDSTHFGEETGK